MLINLTAKAETKKAIFHGLGCEADDWLEGAKKQSASFDGAKHALLQSVKHTQALADAVTVDLDDGKLASMEPLEIAAYAKLQITRAVDGLTNQARHMSNCHLSANGEIAAYEKLIKHFQKLHGAEQATIENIEEALASGSIQLEDDGSVSQTEGVEGRRQTGVRPGSSIAAQRRAEASAEEPKASTEKTGKVKSKSKARKCGSCGDLGHTARSCPDTKEA